MPSLVQSTSIFINVVQMVQHMYCHIVFVSAQKYYVQTILYACLGFVSTHKSMSLCRWYLMPKALYQHVTLGWSCEVAWLFKIRPYHVLYTNLWVCHAGIAKWRDPRNNLGCSVHGSQCIQNIIISTGTAVSGCITIMVDVHLCESTSVSFQFVILS